MYLTCNSSGRPVQASTRLVLEHCLQECCLQECCLQECCLHVYNIILYSFTIIYTHMNFYIILYHYTVISIIINYYSVLVSLCDYIYVTQCTKWQLIIIIILTLLHFPRQLVIYIHAMQFCARSVMDWCMDVHTNTMHIQIHKACCFNDMKEGRDVFR